MVLIVYIIKYKMLNNILYYNLIFLHGWRVELN